MACTWMYLKQIFEKIISKFKEGVGIMRAGMFPNQKIAPSA